MEMTHRYRLAHQAISQSNRLLAVCHRRPDGDTLGSAAAYLTWAERQGMITRAFCLDPVPEEYRFLPSAERFTTDPAVFNELWDTVVVFDAGDLKHAGVDELLHGLRPRPRIIAIDHHFTNERYADIDVVHPHASSTAELVHGIFRENRLPIDRELAMCLLVGLINDTDSLTNPAAHQSAFAAASDLLAGGADWQTTLGLFVKNRPIESLRVMGRVLGRLKYDPETGVASSALFIDDCPTGDCQTDGIVNYLGNHLDAEVILLLKERPGGEVRGSLRTVLEADVSAVAQSLGGGGHRKASGFTVTGVIAEEPHGWIVRRTHRTH
jgi:phosphoesterase RecJ-like protein